MAYDPARVSQQQPGQHYPNVYVQDASYAHLGNVIVDNESLIRAQQRAQWEDNECRKAEVRAACHQAFKTSNYEQQKDVNPERAPDTCRWVIDHNLFNRWCEDSASPLLWISADPGCGKSVLSKYLIDNWLSHTGSNFCVCYYFFKDNREQSTLPHALCAVLHQLFAQQPHLIDDHAVPLWRSTGNSLQNETKQLWQVLRRATVDDACRPIICVLDAMDECQDSDRRQLIQLLCEIHAENSTNPRTGDTRWAGRIKFLVTSRPYDSVKRWFEKTIERFPQIRLRGEDRNSEINAEINIVVRACVSELAHEFGLSRTRRDALTNRLLQMKHRTYLWLTLAVEDIRDQLRNSLYPHDTEFDMVPASVGEAYERILSKIDVKQRNTVRAIFKIILGAKKPLTIPEMAGALAVDEACRRDSHKLNFDVKHTEKQIRQWCGLFIFIDGFKLYLIHQTAKEFLLETQSSKNGISSKWGGTFTETDCNAYMAKLTIEYSYRRYLTAVELRNVGWNETHFQSRFYAATTEDSCQDFTPSALTADFDIYCASYWNVHARCKGALADENLLKKAVMLCDANVLEKLSLFWSYGPAIYKEDFLKAVSYCNLTILQRIVADKGVDLNTTGVCGRTMLMLAVEEEDADDIIDWLLANGADVHISRDGLTPLHSAVERAKLDTVRKLIDAGANINVACDQYKSLLQHALDHNQKAIAELLLRSGARVEHDPDMDIEYPLHVAASMGWSNLIEKLIQNGCDIGYTDISGETALHKAVFGNHPDIIDILLYRGAEIDTCAFASDGNTPLMLAAELDHSCCASVLIDWGASVAIKNARGLTPLMIALESASYDVADLLSHYDKTPAPEDFLERVKCNYDENGALVFIDDDSTTDEEDEDVDCDIEGGVRQTLSLDEQSGHG